MSHVNQRAARAFIIIRIVNCIITLHGFDFSCNRVGVRSGFIIRKLMNRKLKIIHASFIMLLCLVFQ